MVYIGAKIAVDPIHLAGLIIKALRRHVAIKKRLDVFAVLFDLPLILLDGIDSDLLAPFHMVCFGRGEDWLVAVVVQIHN